MKRLICALLAAALLLCAPAAGAASAALSAGQLDEMETAAAADPLTVDFDALLEGLTAMAQLLPDAAARQADPAQTAEFDALATRAQALCFAAADALEQRYLDSYDRQSYLDLTALAISRCFWQLAKLDKAAQNTSAYKSHLTRAGQLYYDCAVHYGSENGYLFEVTQEDILFLLAYFAYSGETGGDGRGMLNELLAYEAALENHPLNDYYLAHEEEIDRLLADTGASSIDYPDRGVYSIDGDPWEIGEILFVDDAPYVALASFLVRFGGADLTDYASNENGRSIHWQLYGDDIRASEEEVLLNGEPVELAGPPLWAGGQLYLTLDDAAYLACADIPTLETFSYYPSLLSEETVTGEVYLIRPYLGDDPPAEAELGLLEGIGAPINLQNAIWQRDLPVAEAAGFAPDFLDGVSGMTRGTDNSSYAQYLLSSSWGVNSADDLLQKYDWLLAEGHRFEFREVVSSGGAPDWFLRKWGDDLDENSFLAWDLARAVQICQWGCCAGYLSPYDSTRLALDAAQLLRSAFGSWQEFADDYQMGYDAFLAEDAEGTPYTALRRKIIDQLYAGGSYLGTVAWEPEDALAPSGIQAGAAAGISPSDTALAIVLLSSGWILLELAVGGITLAVVLCRNRRRRRAAVSADPWALR